MIGASVGESRWPWRVRSREPAPPPPTPQASGGAGELARRRLYDDIGDFLFAHGLSIDERIFGIVLAYVTGTPAVVKQMRALIRDGRVDDATVRAIEGAAANVFDAKFLDEMVRRMTAKLSLCLEIVQQSNAATRGYEAALDEGAADFETDPRGAFDRLIALTRSVLAATRTMEERLEVARREGECLRESLDRARRDADLDHLTGLPNRRFLEARLDAWSQQAGGRDVACVAICDVDDFKAVNDRHGHPVGDRVLRVIARSLREGLPGETTVARYGGEEFVCLFERCHPMEAITRLEDVRERLATRRFINHDNGAAIGHVTFSAGVATIGADPERSLRAADDALYQAKRLGKNRIVLAPRAE